MYSVTTVKLACLVLYFFSLPSENQIKFLNKLEGRLGPTFRLWCKKGTETEAYSYARIIQESTNRHDRSQVHVGIMAAGCQCQSRLLYLHPSRMKWIGGIIVHSLQPLSLAPGSSSKHCDTRCSINYLYL